MVNELTRTGHTRLMVCQEKNGGGLFVFSRALAAVPELSSGYTGYTVIHVPFSPSPDYSRVRLCFIVLLVLVLLYICITVFLVILDRETPTFFLLTELLFLL